MSLLGEVLIVDDMLDNLDILKNILSDKGYDVRFAKSGQIALNFLQANLPDIILLDIKMPGMDGFEVCTRLKAEKKTRNIPIYLYKRFV